MSAKTVTISEAFLDAMTRRVVGCTYTPEGVDIWMQNHADCAPLERATLAMTIEGLGVIDDAGNRHTYRQVP